MINGKIRVILFDFSRILSSIILFNLRIYNHILFQMRGVIIVFTGGGVGLEDTGVAGIASGFGVGIFWGIACDWGKGETGVIGFAGVAGAGDIGDCWGCTWGTGWGCGCTGIWGWGWGETGDVLLGLVLGTSLVEELGDCWGVCAWFYVFTSAFTGLELMFAEVAFVCWGAFVVWFNGANIWVGVELAVIYTPFFAVSSIF